MYNLSFLLLAFCHACLSLPFAGGDASNPNCPECPPPENCKIPVCYTSGGQQVVLCLQCNEGWYLDDNNVCTACKVCNSGEWISTECALRSNTICEACDGCPSGQVLTTACDGQSTTDDHVCSSPPTNNCPLPTNCKTSVCSGEGALQTVQCTACNDGWFIDGNGCTACKVCNSGEWISNKCVGNSNTICEACEGCPSGQVLTTACDGQSTTDNHVCSAPPTNNCPLPTNCKAVQCTACNDGWFIDGNGCTACKVCNPGEWITAVCQGYTNTNCAPCGSCPSGQVLTTACDGKSTTDNHVCSSPPTSCPFPTNCKTSVCYGEGASRTVQCTACNDGWYIDGNVCTACKVCNPGEWITAVCQGYTNTNCSPCGKCGAHQTLLNACTGLTTTDIHVCANNP